MFSAASASSSTTRIVAPMPIGMIASADRRAQPMDRLDVQLDRAVLVEAQAGAGLAQRNLRAVMELEEIAMTRREHGERDRNGRAEIVARLFRDADFGADCLEPRQPARV